LALWFFACLFGLLGPMANMAHALGLVFGIVLGVGKSFHYSNDKKISIKMGIGLLFLAVGIGSFSLLIEIYKRGG